MQQGQQSETRLAEASLSRMADAHCHVIDTLFDGTDGSAPSSDDGTVNMTRLSMIHTGTLVVMGTRESDWWKVDTLATATQQQAPLQCLPCFGVHPWFASSVSTVPATTTTTHPPVEEANPLHPPELSDPWIQKLSQLLSLHPHAWIGEIGLDAVATDPKSGSIYPWHQQWSIFDQQMRLAHHLGRPVSVHSVQCHGKMLDYFTKLSVALVTKYGRASKRAQRASLTTTSPPAPILCTPAIMMHSYSGSTGVAKSLRALPYLGPRFYFSFSHVVNARSPHSSERIAAIPDDRILVESDIHDWTRVDAEMSLGVKMIGEAKGWSLDQTVSVLAQNFDAFRRAGSEAPSTSSGDTS